MEASANHLGQPNITPTRVGVVFGGLGKLNVAALKYLIVHLNTLQRSFEFEILTSKVDDPLIGFLGKKGILNRDKCREMLSAFRSRVIDHVAEESKAYQLADDSPPLGIVLITMARFSDGHYGLKSESVQVQALGDWDRQMAPPSIFEFIITLLLRQSVGFAAPSLSKSIHLGTKGCIFDFNADLSDARYKALHGYVCSVCRARLRNDGVEHIADEVVRVLDMQWLGTLADPHCPAGIVAKLGYNLFLTQGIRPTLWETVRAGLRDEGTKELVKLIGGVLLAGLLIWLGLKKPA
jgi:hypothetical protein